MKKFSPLNSYWISSCAGSGKTTLLIERLQQLMETFYIPLNKIKQKKGKILVLTFTCSASMEIQKRLSQNYKLNQQEKKIIDDSKILSSLKLLDFSAKEELFNKSYIVHTFHSFCWSLLQRFRGYGGLPKSLHLLEEEQSILLWEESITDILKHRCETNDQYLYNMLESGLCLKNILRDLFHKRLLLKEQNYPCIFIQQLFEETCTVYEKKKNLFLDYNDVLLWTLHLFHHPETMGVLGTFLHKAFDHILLDEGQDTNTIQWSIFSVLCEHLLWDETKTLFALGDPKQCIYGFQGVNPKGYIHMGKYLSSFLNTLGFKKRLLFYHHQDHYRSCTIPLAFIHKVFQDHSLEFFGEKKSQFIHRGKRKEKGGVFWLEPLSLEENNCLKKEKFLLIPFNSDHKFIHLKEKDKSFSISAEKQRKVYSTLWCDFLTHLFENPLFLPSKNRLSLPQDIILLFPRRNIFFYDLQNALRKKGLMKGGYFIPKDDSFFQYLLCFVKILNGNFVLDDLFFFANSFFPNEKDFLKWMYIVSSNIKFFLSQKSNHYIKTSEEKNCFLFSLFSLLQESTLSLMGQGSSFNEIGDFLQHFCIFLQDKTPSDFLSWNKIFHLLQLLKKEIFFQKILTFWDPLGNELYIFFLSICFNHKDKLFSDFLSWFLEHPVEFRVSQDITLTTIHKTKGEEYPMVFLPDLPSPYSLIPDNGQGRCIDKKILEDFWFKGKEDYWSLLYVALTRCQDFLILSSLPTKQKEKGWMDQIKPLFFPNIKY